MIASPQPEHAPEPVQDFSIVLGGPLYQFFLRSGLIRPPFGSLKARMLVLAGIAWLPLIPLTVLGGRFAGAVPVPFLYDFEVHVRLLVALQLLIVAELVIYVRMRALTAQFLERHIVTPELRPAFEKVISSAMRLRNSSMAEISLLLLVLIAGPWVWRGTVALHSNTWYATQTPSGLVFTAAGWWYGFISVPVFQFILLRWYYRVFIWFRFLSQVSRLDLNLVPTHPDRCCGLGFLGNVAAAFAPLLMAHSALMAGFLANRILHEGAKLPDYKMELLAMTALLIAIGLAPLCVFAPKLHRARLAGLRLYGRLASDYVSDFARKWIAPPVPSGEPLLGTSDIQSLADLDNTFSIVKGIRLVPFNKESVTQFLIVIAIPLAPLALTMFSFEELLRRLIRVIL
jgi:hypothetical protein